MPNLWENEHSRYMKSAMADAKGEERKANIRGE